MPDDFTGDRGEKIDKLIAAVIDIRSSLRIMKWIVTIGLPVLASFVGLAGLAWRDQSTRISDLQRVLGKIEGATLGAVEPLKTASADIKTTATQMKNAAESMSTAAQQIKSSSQDLSAAVARLDTLSRPTSEVAGLVTLNHTNLVQEGQLFMAKFPIPETIDRGRIREIKARVLPIPQISMPSFVLSSARLEFDMYRLQLTVPSKEFPAFIDLILGQKRTINVEVVFVLFER